jgi:hypothetical protein
MSNHADHADRRPVGKYVVYDPPRPGLPYIAVLFRPEVRPRVFIFRTAEEATSFVTSNAVTFAGPLQNQSGDRQDVSWP